MANIQRIIFQPTESTDEKLRRFADETGMSISMVINRIFDSIDNINLKISIVSNDPDLEFSPGVNVIKDNAADNVNATDASNSGDSKIDELINKFKADHPDKAANEHSVLGQTVTMKSGAVATCVADYSAKDVAVYFHGSGIVREHCRRDKFREGSVAERV